MTFAFTDIEGSTERWERDRNEMERAVRRHDTLVREAIVAHRGYVFKSLGDAFCAAFARPADALAAMLAAQRALYDEDFSALGGLRVRAAIHTGTADEREGDYFGPAVNRTARLLAIGHGGQVLVSGATTAIARHELPPRVTLRDLGEHRLKDLALPEQVYQLSEPDFGEEFPPLRSLDAMDTNLPLQLTSFVGRENELAEITKLVSEHRLVTLVGAGGVGKTRTALQVAANRLDDSNGTSRLVELGPLASGEFVAPTVATALGVTLPAGHEPIETIVRALKLKEALLVFDNCEHLLAPTAQVIGAILRGCPKVRILASSRQSLGIAGERTYRLPSLELPREGALAQLSAKDASRSAAIALFVDRARSVDERFTLTDENASTIAAICRRLDGIPLAIELAAARAAVLSPKQLAEKLNERFRLLAQTNAGAIPRQQTLRALIDWSFDLLDPQERTAFCRLSVFAGGWTLDAATAVCTDDTVDEWRALELLSALAAKSLVVVEADADDRRYDLLNSIREYSRERLEETGEADEIAATHARYYGAFVGDLAPLVESLEDGRWQNAIVPEIDNVRAAMDWAVFRNNDVPAGKRLLARLEWPELLTTPHEAIAWFDAAAASDAEVDATTNARVLRHRVRLEWLVGRPIAERERSGREALAAASASADPNEIAYALASIASIHRDAGRFDEAERLFSEASDMPEALSPVVTNAILRNWAISNLQRGNLELARQRFTEVAKRERPGSEAHASALLNIGELEFAAGNLEAAREAARRARETFVHLNAAPAGLAICNLAAYAMALDELDEARALLQEALQGLRQSGTRWMITALEHHAVLAGLTGDHERAALLLGFTDKHYGTGDTRQTTERHGYERLIGLLSNAYGERELADKMAAGAWLSDEQALEHAAAINPATLPNRRRTPPKKRK